MNTINNRPTGSAARAAQWGTRRQWTKLRTLRSSCIIALGFALAGCSPPPDSAAGRSTADPATTTARSTTSPVTSSTASSSAAPASRQAFFGDLHVHTRLSFDAYIFGTRSTPDSAYRYAKGEPLAHPSGFSMQLDQPLDFLGVTDHAMYMGMLEEMADPQTTAGKHPVAVKIREAQNPAERIAAFQEMFPYLRQQLDGPDDLLQAGVLSDAWTTTVAAAETHNDPGTFTTFVAYEYTAAGSERENLHRNVVFANAAPPLPFSSMDSSNPEDLWNWMDQQREAGVEALAIPHNSNGSDGLMFELTQTDGTAMTAAYAEQRMRNEPLVEITQVKGTSDTHPLLSPNDEWANFEIMDVKVATVEPSKANGSYVREAYLNGLMLEYEFGFNPYRFGLIGSSDTHVGAGSFDETNYWSKVGIVDGTSIQRGSVPMAEPDADGNRYAGAGIATFETWGASGLAGVWAEENTRAALYAAMRRKETFATSGPRLRLRLFAGYDLNPALNDAADPAAELYATAVPMGADLPAAADEAASLQLFVWALRDAASAPLERLQIIKGELLDDGSSKETVIDIACAGDRVPVDGRCPGAPSTVDLSTCAIAENAGNAELKALWTDPTYQRGQRAFYYARVLEVPTCRWSTWDALRAGVAPRTALPPLCKNAPGRHRSNL